ncbi:MAG: hypothetical protein CBD58_02425 [bacterium TMED198]|nr:MAG: hypothetical protein CBD58_02425 [bacterium TMED198]
MYYYSNLVDSWGSPPDTIKINETMKNLKMWCTIYDIIGQNKDELLFDNIHWSNMPSYIETENFFNWSTSIEMGERYSVSFKNIVYFGGIDNFHTTAVETDNYVYYIVIDYQPPSNINAFLYISALIIFFMIILSISIRKYLYPVKLLKRRIKNLNQGDLKSEVEIISDDELGVLSKNVNSMIGDIRLLLNQKQALLLDVSHELRSPLTRMQLLIEMLPKHKNINKIKNEILYLEEMISNLLLSDKLSIPYKNLDLKSVSIMTMLDNVFNLFPNKRDLIQIDNQTKKDILNVDETKIVIALRNLLDNAFKYSPKNKEVEVIIKENEFHYFIHIKDYGKGIKSENHAKIFDPFFREQTSKIKGFGLGLTICKKIVEAHKGSLTFDSKYEIGTIFTITLPKI